MKIPYLRPCIVAAHRRRRIAQLEFDLLSEYVRSIRVEDASGARFEMHEFVVRRWLMTKKIFELDTGELARPVDGHTFQLLRTGEPMMRV